MNVFSVATLGLQLLFYYLNWEETEENQSLHSGEIRNNQIVRR